MRKMKVTIITILLAFVAVVGQAQDSITITFQLASKAKGEMVTQTEPSSPMKHRAPAILPVFARPS